MWILRCRVSNSKPIAIVDYGLGNVFSILRALEHSGIPAKLTASKEDIVSAPGVILPGVGAFGDAMTTLNKLGLSSILKEVATNGKPLLGICLGLQLLMTESNEFGHHQGLGLIEGDVVKLNPDQDGVTAYKVPEVSWNKVNANQSWKGTILDGMNEGTYQYFVHSYYVRPKDSSRILSTTQYGSVEFCSSVQKGNICATQFHPERSGEAGLKIYKNFVNLISRESYV